jgi:hypothetical protein
VLRDGEGVFYDELETRVRLSKRRSKKGVAANRSTFLAVKHREMEPDELTNQVGCDLHYTIDENLER